MVHGQDSAGKWKELFSLAIGLCCTSLKGFLPKEPPGLPMARPGRMDVCRDLKRAAGRLIRDGLEKSSPKLPVASWAGPAFSWFHFHQPSLPIKGN